MNEKFLAAIEKYFPYVIMAIVFAIVCFLIYEGATSPSRPLPETPREKCEKMGGFYGSGGFWDLPDNCIFPPKQ